MYNNGYTVSTKHEDVGLIMASECGVNPKVNEMFITELLLDLHSNKLSYVGCEEAGGCKFKICTSFLGATHLIVSESTVVGDVKDVELKVAFITSGTSLIDIKKLSNNMAWDKLYEVVEILIENNPQLSVVLGDLLRIEDILI